MLLNFMLMLLANTACGAAPVPHPTSSFTEVWFGEGCFWERQYAYIQVELNQTGPFKRNNRTVTSVVGYSGSKHTGPGGLVCFDNEGPTPVSYPWFLTLTLTLIE